MCILRQNNSTDVFYYIGYFLVKTDTRLTNLQLYKTYILELVQIQEKCFKIIFIQRYFIKYTNSQLVKDYWAQYML